MYKTIKQFKFLLITLLLVSCQVENKNGKMIVGNWRGVAWFINNEPSKYNAALTTFNFTDSGTYIFTYDATVEKGSYKVENEMLFTKPTNQQEIMVKIVKLTADSLIFDMNRGGQPEQLILLKK